MAFDFNRLNAQETRVPPMNDLPGQVTAKMVSAKVGYKVNGDLKYQNPYYTEEAIIPQFVPLIKKIRDNELSDSVFSRIKEIIVKGDKPVINCDEGLYQTGLSARLELSRKKNYEELSSERYFWMSWLMSRVPIFIVPFDIREKYVRKIKSDESKTGKEYVSDVLGLYIPNTVFAQPIIFICIDKIVEYCNNSRTGITVDELVICTVIHELAHAVMDIRWQISDCDKVTYSYKDAIMTQKASNKEEAWANALMLQYLKRYGDENLFKHVLDFTKTQPEGYNKGEEYMNLAYVEENPQNWFNWYLEKLDWTE